MAWFGRSKEQNSAEAALMGTFYAAARAAAEAYDVARSRVDDNTLVNLFSKLGSSHLNYANTLRKRVKQLGADPEAGTGIGDIAGRWMAGINAVGTVRDLLIALRVGEENGVAMCRDALENMELSGKTRGIIQGYNQAHIDNIRNLSEQIALRSSVTETMASSYAPQWLRYPKPGFWLLQAGLLGLGYLFGRRGGNSQGHQRLGGRAASSAEEETLSARQVGQ
jgi:hypothetical protein